MAADEYHHNSKNYQWPADKLTAIEMAILYKLRQATGKPINQLLREAILKLSDVSDSVNSNKIGEHHAEKK